MTAQACYKTPNNDLNPKSIRIIFLNYLIRILGLGFYKQFGDLCALTVNP